MAISIRSAVPADAPALSELAARTFAETFGDDNTPEDLALHLAKSFSADAQRAEIADSRMMTLLLDVDGVLAGFAQVRTCDPPPCVHGPEPIELWRFYVDRPWHGAGLAQQLMTAVMNAARGRAARTLWLGVWEHNLRAQAFYRKCGFADVGAQSFMLGTDLQTDRVMSRDIST